MLQINIDLYGNNVWFYLYILYVRDHLGDVTDSAVASSVVDPGFDPSSPPGVENQGIQYSYQLLSFAAQH